MTEKVLKEKRFLHFGLSTGQYEACVLDYPEVKDYMEFLKMVVSITKEEEYNYNTNWFIDNDFLSCLKVCEELKDKMDMILKEKDLIRALMINLNLDKWLVLLFKPESCDNICVGATSIMELLDIDFTNVVIHDERIRLFINRIIDMSKNHKELKPVFIMHLVFFHCYMNNNYDYLDKLLNDYTYYSDKINLNYSNATVKALYNDMDKIFAKPHMIIK